MTSLRELFEETGILLGQPVTHQDLPCRAAIDSERQSLKKDPSAFQRILHGYSTSARVDDLLHFCTFITPTFEKRRYETHFFAAEVDEADCSAMAADGHETAALLWLDPAEAVELQKTKKISFLPPQFYIFNTLSKSQDIDSIFSTESISLNKYNRKTGVATDFRGLPAILPTVVRSAASTGAAVTLALPFDEAHDQWPGDAGSRHRIVCGTPIGYGDYILEDNLAEYRPL